MESRSAIILCLVVAVLASQTLAHPKVSEVSQEIRKTRDVEVAKEPETETKPALKKLHSLKDRFLNEEDQIVGEKKDLPTSDKDEKREIEEAATKLTVRFPEEESRPTLAEDDESLRSKKSPALREMTFHTSPTTTVCIQVRSDSRQVVCGPQVTDDKKEEPLPSARYNQGLPPPPEYYNQYNGMPIQQYPAPIPMNVQTHGVRVLPPFRLAASAQPPQPIMMQPVIQQRPTKLVQEPLPMTPKGVSPGAARGPAPLAYPMRRNEEDPNLKPAEENIPSRNYPQPIPPVYVHKQFYQAPVMVAQAQPALRLNCAVQPDGTIIQSYPIAQAGNNGLRNIYPFADTLIPKMAEGPLIINGRTLYMDGQRLDQTLGSPYILDNADPIIGSTFLGEDGQQYIIGDPNVRSSEDDSQQQMKWNQELLQALGLSTDDTTAASMDDLQKERDQQGKELKEAKEQLVQLQQEMKEMQQRAAVDEEKKGAKKDLRPAENLKDSSQPSQVSMDSKKAEMAMKQSKRQAYGRM